MALRAGIVGCGGISRSHATAYTNLEGVALTALCDINPAALDARADEFGVSGRYTDYEAMFESEKLDLVSVCTHAPQHAPVAIAAAKHGVDVLSEKPLSVDLQTADRMVAACAEAGVRLAISHQYRFTPLFQEAKAWIEAGRIGEFRSIREVGKGREAGFELMEMGVHYFDEMAYFMGGIDWIHAQISYQGHAVGVEDIMPSSQLCRTDKRDNGIVAGDTMMVHIQGPGRPLRRHGTVSSQRPAWMADGPPHSRFRGADYGQTGPQGRPRGDVVLPVRCFFRSQYATVGEGDNRPGALRDWGQTVAGPAIDLERARYGQLDSGGSPATARRCGRSDLSGVRQRRLRVPFYRCKGHSALEGAYTPASQADVNVSL